MIDLYDDPAVKKRMLELQQRLYRKGHRNGTDAKGNGTYVLTQEDKITCLDPAHQVSARRELDQIKRLRKLAEPFELSIGIGEMPPSYVVSIRHPNNGGYARRNGPCRVVDNQKDPEKWFIQQIDSMKAELGYTMKPIPLETYPGDANIARFVQMEQDLAERKKQQGYAVTDKRSSARAPLVCPEHGNLLVRGSEPGTLVCTVAGCKKVARKKLPAAFAKGAPAAEKEAETSEEVKQDIIETIEEIKGAFSFMAVKDEIQGFEEMIGRQFAVSPGVVAPSVPQLRHFGLQRNPNLPMYVQDGSQHYLVQRTILGEVYIDITSVVGGVADVQAGAFLPRDVAVPPVVFNNPGQLVVLKLER